MMIIYGVFNICLLLLIFFIKVMMQINTEIKYPTHIILNVDKIKH